MNEAETRADLIDPALKEAGWGVVEMSRVRREVITPGPLKGYGQKRGEGLKADYVLVYRGRRLAVVEAKAYDKHYTEGIGQAKDYAAKLKVRFAYSTNGQRIYRVDMLTGDEDDEPRFPTPDELWALTSAESNDWRDRFALVPFEDRGGFYQSRYYQDIAIERVLDAVADGRRRVLLTLATGTGKTFVAFQVAWKLFQSRWNLSGEPTRRPRILFLADRNILADQAYLAFTAFDDASPGALVRIDPGEIGKRGRVPKNGSIFFTIFQTFMSGPGETPYFGEYPPGFFDLVVIDECHRGGANDESKWRGILDYFQPAVQFGLTATPKRTDNVDTYAYFGEPVYTYSLREGTDDGFLTPFRVKQITTTLDEYVYAPDDTLVEGETEPGRRFGEEDFNRTIVIEERERKRVQIFMDQINQDEKTLVFCASQEHAALVRDLVNRLKKSRDTNYCVRVTAADGKLGEVHLREFQDNDKRVPTVLTTSRKLSTGVDARNVRNIVLLRPVKTMIEFKQIIGRGTRLFEGKDYFTVYDFVGAHQHFKDPEWDGEPLEPEPPKTPAPRAGTPAPGRERAPRRKIVVKLSDDKARAIRHTMVTTFHRPDGTQMTAQEFLEELYGKLPELFKDEAELRTLWSDPITRARLLQGLEERGFGREQMAEMQRIVDAENSDLFDVLAHVAYALPPLTREERAARAKAEIGAHFSSRQQIFLDFVLSHYVSAGVEELGEEMLTPLIKLKYNNSIQDGLDDLGGDEEAWNAFTGFQKYLYQNQTTT
ncbi:MAG: DEAD/DEAH box helicase family protein [Acidobacteriota bacterium]|nr:DEAD/DEAH box helicase family protein [Acidobacteriota bacterium]